MSEHDFSLPNVWLTFFGCFLNFVFFTSGTPDRGIASLGRRPYNVDPYEVFTLTPWISNDFQLGQVSGVSLDPDDNVYLFHRADRVWDDQSFREDNVYNQQHLGPITQPTILIFKPDGTCMEKIGQDIFFLPHGITVDSQFNIWVTDVALHQVMKFEYPRLNNYSLILGEKFVPGKDSKHFCKPTSVAVVSNGDFFVADGYCNSRILKFNSDGNKILEWGRETNIIHPPGKYELNIPHALTLAEDKGLVCTADRENGRIVCYKIENGDFVFQMSSNFMGDIIFSVAYSNGKFFAVNGRSRNMNVPVGGFVLGLSRKIIGQFGSNLNTPHDLAVSSNGSIIYVAEINPNKTWKYIINKINITSIPEISQKGDSNTYPNAYSKSVDDVEGLTGAVLVTFGCFVFSVGLCIAVIIYSKSRRSASSDTRRLLSNIDY